MKRIALPRAAIMTICLLLLASQPGCDDGGRITQENYQQIKPGMTLAQVESILGSGREDSSPTGMSISGAGIGTSKDAPQEKMFVWEDGTARIMVMFVKGKAETIQKAGF